ncbi:MAG: hypothetical protein IH838_06645 [Proteobacteria bacterium]|nr:hypothetical protein [Pseudomonadota bacterium]
MNCISGSTLLTCLFACAACGAPASETDTGKTTSSYSVHYTITPDSSDGSVAVEMAVEQTRGQLREVSFELGRTGSSDFTADGWLDIRDNGVTWQPGRKGGSLRWRVRPSHRRGNNGYDAWLNEKWGIFRAEDIIPRARTRTLKGAISKTTMTFELPGDWSAVSEYSTFNTRIKVTNPARRFDQPRGWIVMGDLGIRRETIAGTRIAIAAPQGETVRRMDMLALLNWTLPELNAVVPTPIRRLTIVSAGDPMWRGGLSAPGSIFIHAERPLISENATSTLVHEVVHVAFDLMADEGFDWIVEGLAEYYSLELLQRGGAITTRRYNRALEKQTAWAREAASLCAADSTGATTALAVITFRTLDKEIRNKSKGASSLDELVARMSGTGTKITLRILRELASEILDGPSDSLHTDNLPGCRSFAPPAGA